MLVGNWRGLEIEEKVGGKDLGRKLERDGVVG